MKNPKSEIRMANDIRDSKSERDGQPAQSPSRRLFVALTLLLLSTLNVQLSTARAQQYSIDWYKVAGGGGISTGGTYQVSGTIGQHDAGGPMAGGSYSVTGGFWALYAVQTPGLPNLNIWFVGPDSVVVSWLNTGSYTLQTNSILSAPSWNAYGGPVTTLTGTNRVTITPPQGNLFFRLEQ